MKLLLDQNIASRLATILQPAFPGSKHVKDFGMEAEADEAIWAFAAQHRFTIVTKDADFLYLAILRGHPPKVVHLRLGNCPTPLIAQRLLTEEQSIKAFIDDPDESLLDIE